MGARTGQTSPRDSFHYHCAYTHAIRNTSLLPECIRGGMVLSVCNDEKKEISLIVSPWKDEGTLSDFNETAARFIRENESASAVSGKECNHFIVLL